jgi:uncharacterized protein (DUF924 family)
MTTLDRSGALALCLTLTARHRTHANHDAVPTTELSFVDATEPVPGEARQVIRFWRDAGPARWFAKDAAFDATFRRTFLAAYEAAAGGRLEHWRATPQGALALLLLVDQFPRNAFRDTPRMYATDVLARAVADTAIARGHDRAVEDELRLFFYLPFAHSEELADQERSVELCRSLRADDLRHAEGHRDIIRRFGRFPHRNPILGRAMTGAEQDYLDRGGFAG